MVLIAVYNHKLTHLRFCTHRRCVSRLVFKSSLFYHCLILHRFVAPYILNIVCYGLDFGSNGSIPLIMSVIFFIICLSFDLSIGLLYFCLSLYHSPYSIRDSFWNTILSIDSLSECILAYPRIYLNFWAKDTNWVFKS